jgi:hypothetical protein
MEVRDGFIVGVFNYCDSWCKRCIFTSRCHVFADIALHEDANDACRNPPSLEEWERIGPRIPSEHAPIDRRARKYAFRVHLWRTARDESPHDASDEATEVITWFHFLISAKINRALNVWPDEDPEYMASDADGSAKVALIGIERSHAAWLDLVERGLISAVEAEPFIADLVWLGESLEQARPRARAFIRPGFDEPEAVAKLLASEQRTGNS